MRAREASDEDVIRLMNESGMLARSGKVPTWVEQVRDIRVTACWYGQHEDDRLYKGLVFECSFSQQTNRPVVPGTKEAGCLRAEARLVVEDEARLDAQVVRSAIKIMMDIAMGMGCNGVRLFAEKP